MNTLHNIISLTNSRAEMLTSDLGLAAYNGYRDEVQEALDKGVDWEVEGKYLLSSAIFGQQWDIARDILKAGMPISDSVYKQIYYWGNPLLLSELPPRPDIIEPLKKESKKHMFLNAIVEGDLVNTKRLYEFEWLNIESAILGDRVVRQPLHYAALFCYLEIIKFLIEAGAEVNTITGDNQSALNLVARCSGVDKSLRKKCFSLIHTHGGKIIPPTSGWFEYWCLSRGAWRSLPKS